MTRTRTQWKIRDHALTIGERTLIMGVLNVTPDSFSDGGRYLDPDAAAARALELEQEGADILDIGAESTRPGSERINAGEELRRLVPVLKKLKGKLSIPISVDTYKAEVAAKALEHGASVINDVSALTWEPDLLKPVVQYDAGLILNHMRGTPETWAKLGPMKDVVGSLIAELEAAVHRAVRGGVARDRIVIDPGIGFGKRGEQNSEILARLGELRRLLLPILAATSRKSFLSQEEPKALEFATAAAVSAAILHGASIVRVHDVLAMKPVVQTADAIVEATPVPEEKPKPTARPRLDSEVQAEKRSRPVRPPTPPKEKEEQRFPVFPEETRPAEKPSAPEPIRAQEEERPRRPFEKRSAPPQQDRPPRRRFDEDRPEPRPFTKKGPPARQGRPSDSKPYERRDRPFTPRDERSGDRPDRRPFQRSGAPAGPRNNRPGDGKPGDYKPRDSKTYDRTGRPPRKTDDRDRKPFDRDRRDDRPRKPFQKAGGPDERSDRRPPSGRPPSGPKFDNRGARPSGPRNDRRDDRPSGPRPPRPGSGFGGGRPGGGPKRPGGPPRSGPPRGPKKRS